MVRVKAHTATIATLRLVPVLMESMSGTCHLRILPRRAVPTGIPIDVRRLTIIDMRIGYDRMLQAIEGYLPHPVTNASCFIDNRSRIVAGIGVGLIDIECAIGNLLQFLAVQVAQDRTVAVVNVNDVEVEPVGHLVIRMPRGVTHIYLILAVARILGIGTGTC